MVVLAHAPVRTVVETSRLIAEAHTSNSSIQSNAQIIVLAFLAFAILIAVVLTVLITLSLVGPLLQLTRASRLLAGGNTDVEAELPPTSHSETGELSFAFRTMVEHQQDMATAAKRIAAGDLASSVQPKTEADVLGQAIAIMTETLRSVLSRVNQSAEAVDVRASQLALTTRHAGQASTQIARAIEDVARGASEQNKGSAEMLQTVGVVAAAMKDVASGAAQQAVGSGPFLNALQGIGTALNAANESLSSVTQAATQASQTALAGGQVMIEQSPALELCAWRCSRAPSRSKPWATQRGDQPHRRSD